MLKLPRYFFSNWVLDIPGKRVPESDLGLGFPGGYETTQVGWAHTFNPSVNASMKVRAVYDSVSKLLVVCLGTTDQQV